MYYFWRQFFREKIETAKVGLCLSVLLEGGVYVRGKILVYRFMMGVVVTFGKKLCLYK